MRLFLYFDECLAIHPDDLHCDIKANSVLLKLVLANI
jgi:hypothetical protein